MYEFFKKCGVDYYGSEYYEKLKNRDVSMAVLYEAFEDELDRRVPKGYKGTDEEFNRLVENLKAASEASETVKLAVGTCFGDAHLDIRKAMHDADERMYQDKDAYYKKHPELQYRSNKQNG